MRTYKPELLQAEVIRGLEALDPLVHEWGALAQSRRNVFVSPEWFTSFARSNADVVTPFVIVVRDGSGEVRGLLPFVEGTGREAGVLRFAGRSLGDLFHPVAAPESEVLVASAAASALRAQRREWNAVALDDVPRRAQWVRTIVQDLGTSVPALERGRGSHPLIEPSAVGWESFLASRSRSLRKELGRDRRRLEREHAVTFRSASRPERLREDVTTFLALHDRRRAQIGKTSVLAGERERGFLRDFIRRAFGRGWLRLGFLELDGEPAAAQCSWAVDGRLATYLPGFDASRSRQSIGFLLLGEEIRIALDAGAHEIDLGLGAHPYKLRLATGMREVQSLVFARSLGSASARLYTRAGLARVRARLRQVALPTAHDSR